MSELMKPCPFCGGGEIRFDESRHWTGQRSITVSHTLRHWCESISERHPLITITQKEKEECIAAWNKRIGDKS